MRKPFTVIEGGLSKLDSLMGEFADNAPFEFTLQSEEELGGSELPLSEALQKEVFNVTAPAETDEFILKTGPFLIDP